ncbi:MAG: tetratricopeptide repeat protein [Pseudomonadota bacterium]
MKALVVLFVFLLSATAGAAESKASRSTFVKLMDVQELWEEERYDEAIFELEELIESARSRPHDFALANQYLAHTAVMMGEQESARAPLEAALEMSGLPPDLEGSLKMFYAQIVLADEEYDLARRMFDDWLAIVEEPPKPAQLFSVAYANYQSGYLAEADTYVTRAITESSNPPQNWLRLRYQILFDLEDYAAAERVVVELLDQAPGNEQYWRLLASHHMRLEDYAPALATLEVAGHAGALSDESDLRRLSSLYGNLSVPEKAARKLEAWLEEQRIENDGETWRQVGDLWMLAREREQAKAALWKSVELRDDAKTYEFLASIHFEDAEWDESFQAFEKALGMREAEGEALHRLEMLTGLTAMRAGDDDKAREYLKLAERSDTLRGQVRGLLRELEGG